MAFFGSQKIPRDLQRSVPKEFLGLISMDSAEGMQGWQKKLEESITGDTSWRVQWKILRCCTEIHLDTRDYPSDIKSRAVAALRHPTEPVHDHIRALLDHPDRIRAAQDIMAQTWEKRKSNTEKFLEGLEKQIKSGQA